MISDPVDRLVQRPVALPVLQVLILELRPLGHAASLAVVLVQCN
jgi:hypothetical protein